MNSIVKTLDELRTPAVAALCAAGTSADNAESVVAALLAAEADGLKGHGLSRIPSYVAQARSGKVDGQAVPVVEQVAGAAVRIDAKDGFAYPALSLAFTELCRLAPRTGVAAAAVTNSHHCGAAGYQAERLARAGLIGMVFGNSPHAIAPWGGSKAVFGTNPIAFAAPRDANSPVVVDLALSKVARGKVLVAQQKGEAIPNGWALDEHGHPTTNADDALRGTMLPMGDAKGAALVLMVEIIAAALTGGHFGFEASSFFTADGPSPRVGQFLLAFDAAPFSGGGFGERLEVLLAEVTDQENVRLPGDRRLGNRRRAEEEGVALPEELYSTIIELGRT